MASMPVVDIKVNGRTYQLSCNAGEEAHLANLAEYFDRRVGELATNSGKQVGEVRLMLMAGLMVADDLSTLLDRVERLEAEAQRQAATSRAVDALLGEVEGLATRVEALADLLEST
ncbi:MAG: cell division protein ZapA [Alphaproteobacteria bacterium]|nr:cell division protein ZapA [Alphaproteobacteria bacterium]